MELKSCGPGFCAEVFGAGLGEVAERDDVYAAVRAAFEEHSVLIFRGQPVTDELQVAYSKRFGPLEIAKAASRGEGTPFSILTNIEPDGSLVPPDHKEALRARANQLWHTDSCFKDPPALASVLSARVISPIGGETEFASMRHGRQTPARGTTTRTRAGRSPRISHPSASGRRCRRCAGGYGGATRPTAATRSTSRHIPAGSMACRRKKRST